MAWNVFEWLMEHVFMWFFVLLISGACIFLLVIPFVIYADSQSPTFSLKKSDWGCSHTHIEQSTTYVMSGQVMIPITSQENVCDQYSRAS